LELVIFGRYMIPERGIRDIDGFLTRCRAVTIGIIGINYMVVIVVRHHVLEPVSRRRSEYCGSFFSVLVWCGVHQKKLFI
jgi:hypothetical protein